MLLGLSGKALSGKDTIADYLISVKGWDIKVPFAHNLKYACKEIFHLRDEQIFDQIAKGEKFNTPVYFTFNMLEDIIKWMNKTHTVSVADKYYLHLIGVKLSSPREILQFVGTDVMRYYISDYHCESTIRLIDSNKNTIITDVRFPNEASMIRGAGGRLIRINRPDLLKGFALAKSGQVHESEVALDTWMDWDYIINNDKIGLDTLYEAIDTMLDTWRRG